jgi:DNA-binding MarR family transcriptional regulator
VNDPNRVPLAFDPIAEARDLWISHGWREAAGGMSIVTSIARVGQLLTNRADRILKPFGLTFPRYELLMLLLFSRNEELTQRKIAQRLQVGAPSVTNAIDRLESDKHVIRRIDPDDRRGVFAKLTEFGRQTALDATEKLNEDVFEQIELTESEIVAVFCKLQDLRRRCGDFI